MVEIPLPSNTKSIYSQFYSASLRLTTRIHGGTRKEDMLNEVVCKDVEDVWPLSRSHTFSKEQAGQGQQLTHPGPPHNVPLTYAPIYIGVAAHGFIRILVKTRGKRLSLNKATFIYQSTTDD